MNRILNNHEDGKFVVKAIIIAVFMITIVGYSIFQAHKIITGPQIAISSPIADNATSSSEVEIKGQAKNIAFISLDDRPIYVDKQGNFSEKLLLYPGYNIIKMYARDQFGATVDKQLGVVYEPS